MPLRAFVAGLFFNFIFSIPPSLKEPDFFTCSTATPMNASTTPFTSLVFIPVVSATDWNTPVCVIAPPAFAAALRAFMAFFMAFIAFIAFIACEVRWATVCLSTYESLQLVWKQTIRTLPC